MQPRTRSQAGGITIMVALMLLVLLTIAAVGMSRNSFRETVISGTVRQGAMTRNTADSGIEWGLYWIHTDSVASPTPTATALKALKNHLNMNEPLSGRAFDPSTLSLYDTANPPAYPADLTLPIHTSASGTVTTSGYSVALIRMGKLPVADMTQTADASGSQAAAGKEVKQAPDLWALRSDARVTVGTGLLAPTYVHSKEAWITTPVR